MAENSINVDVNELKKAVKKANDTNTLDNLEDCIKKKIAEAINNNDIDTANKLIELLERCKKMRKKINNNNEVEFSYSNTKEDYSILKSAYLGNNLYELDHLTFIMTKVKILELLTTKKEQ